jgi:hypothetical protein
MVSDLFWSGHLDCLSFAQWVNEEGQSGANSKTNYVYCCPGSYTGSPFHAFLSSLSSAHVQRPGVFTITDLREFTEKEKKRKKRKKSSKLCQIWKSYQIQFQDYCHHNLLSQRLRFHWSRKLEESLRLCSFSRFCASFSGGPGTVWWIIIAVTRARNIRQSEL